MFSWVATLRRGCRTWKTALPIRWIEDRGSNFEVRGFELFLSFLGLQGAPRLRGWIGLQIVVKPHPRTGAGADF